MDGPVITVEHLSKSYGQVVAVRDASFQVERGEIVGLLGPNGCGKTTTVECLQGLRRADGGTIRVLGYDPGRQAAQLRLHIGSQLQESALPERIKVWEALRLFSSLARGGPPWETVMREWGLADKRDASFAGLSGGQRQRLFVALALVNAPELVFLDEMTTGLDPASRRVAWGLIERVRDQGATVVLVTHFMDEAERLCDRVLVLGDHRIIAEGTPVALIERFGGATEVSFTAEGDFAFLAKVDGVERVEHSGRRVLVRGTGPLLALVAAELVRHGCAPADLSVRRATLEDVYLALTDGNGQAAGGP